ncbi:asparagine synthase (glutamine-hydrolyzing) [Blastochloris viridis]|uniref:asparagine synthase (glutamine-hydrolyzing) n=1 Tax=Blastochloris viridis TaxID=1079 RepID=A0A0H5BB37_BLAVI|nr:asparagine synthase (glutamine-hydrolyzing) [Blastochloris viridis]ALK08404.1 Asparagine synthetase [glutamine-hydrolyzing] 1 [Blastochloris viridis]BAR98319.1 asparagine synthetase [glutamine-hydrolyzing] [Blastochloris viridis]CUU41066.1 Asparagine synthetase [glutamine-hydrolyzing] 1 [Blastochloris viridis]
MCGIAGLIDPRLAGNAPALARSATAMADAIVHRGPDDGGCWVDAGAGAALSHRRLAIVDLTAAGAQPMVSTDGRWVVSYNGEIYNAGDLRRHPALNGVDWRGHSDTEAIIESVARRSLDATVADLNGMFALALWDRRERRLHLVRDRLGIKPLFFAASGTRLAFGSELKALRALDGTPRTIDPRAVASFLRFGYVPAPHAIFHGVEKLLPGEIVSFAADGGITRRRYWRLDEVAAAGRADPLEVGDAEAVELLAALLGDAVGRQMMADVPLGAFLSGGIDSSTVAALMVAAAKGPVRTFSIGFPDFGFDEAVHAAAVARHLGTRHTELVVTAADALAVVPRLAEMYDEPFADSSQIPTHLVAKLTRGHVTVALSGDGGDELFAGYNRHLLAARDWPRLAHIPAPLRRAAARALGAMPAAAIDRAARALPRRLVPAQPGEKLTKLASVLALDPAALYQRLVSQVPDPTRHLGAAEYPPGLGEPPAGLDLLDAMRFSDTETYLPDDILQKVDRASMAVALEARPPLLDHRVVEFAWRLPRRFLVRGGETKWILRRVLDRFVPPALIDRPKMGFAIPLADWLRGPLRDWAGDLLDADSGVLDPAPARALWREHLGGSRNHASQLWTLIMFEAWRRRWG